MEDFYDPFVDPFIDPFNFGGLPERYRYSPLHSHNSIPIYLGERDMTLILGFHAEGGIVLASDSRSTELSGRFHYEDKIIQLNKYGAIVFSGTVEEIHSIYDDFKNYLPIYRNKTNNERMANKECMSGTFTNHSKRTGYNSSMHIIFGGYFDNEYLLFSCLNEPISQTYSKPCLYERERGKIIVVGASYKLRAWIEEYFHEKYIEILPIKKVVKLAIEGIKKFGKNNVYFDDNPQIAIITSEGIKIIKGKEEIEKYLED